MVVYVCVNTIYIYICVLNSHCSSLASLGLVHVILSFPTLDVLGLGLFLGFTIGFSLDYNQARRAFLERKLLAPDLPEFDPGVKSSEILLLQ